METARPPKALRRILNIKPGEGKLALLLFLYFFLITAPYMIIKALRTTTFLVKEGAGALPVAYLLATVATGLVVLFHSKLQFRMSIRALIIASLVFFVVSGLLLQWVLQTEFGRRSAFLSYFYWVWASVLIVVLITHFWMTINELFNPREAKRLIGFLNSGGILGAVLGGLLVGFLSEGALGVWLLPLGCVMLFAGVFVVGAIFSIEEERLAAVGGRPAEEKERGGQRAGFRDSFDSVRKNKFLVLIAGIVAIGVIVSICIEFQFLSAAVAHFVGRPRAMQSFFGFFDPALTVFAFFLNYLMAGYFIKKLRVVRSLMLTPTVLLVCSLAILLTPFALLSGIIIRGSEESLDFSLNHPVREILYIPVAAHLKHKAEAFIDMFVYQFGKVLGALVLLVFALLMKKEIDGLTPVFNPGLAKDLSWVVIAFLILWALLGLKSGKEYLATLKANIRPLWDRAEQVLKEKLDLESAKMVFDTIDSRNYSSVLYFLHLFDLLAKDQLSPEIKRIVAEKSLEVRTTALNDRFEAEGAGHLPETSGEFLPEDIVTEIPIIMSSADYQQLMTPYLENVLRETRGSEIEKMELAKAAGLMQPNSPLADWLTRLIDDDSPRVSCLALRSAARLKKESYIPAIIRKLDNFVTLEDAIGALREYGDTAIGVLEEILHDGLQETALRMAVVEVLGRIGTRKAVRALTEELEHGAGKLDEGIIDALDRIRSENMEIPLSASAAKRKTFSLIKKYCQTYIDIQHQDPGGEKAGLQRRYLESCFADIFKLLGLYYPQRDIRTAYQNIKAGTRNSFAHATEWLDNALKKDVKDAILPMIEDLDPEEKTKRFQKILKDLADL
jgi:AAA family ATP:ADP antiporter